MPALSPLVPIHMLTWRVQRDKKRVADAVLEKEKNRPVGQVFDARFSWADMADAVADVYLGVSLPH